MPALFLAATKNAFITLVLGSILLPAEAADDSRDTECRIRVKEVYDECREDKLRMQRRIQVLEKRLLQLETRVQQHRENPNASPLLSDEQRLQLKALTGEGVHDR